ncbi:hypothetical protein G7085_04790 [Tessaracoccus sp. HDW20]|uniref:hypothetical protein n=1 Tax=Tessaracoccus coleopterorum TaxID=2714950 RepID=UPI0018D45096|nr:hypothetical protein [Tessaracoccus coleopterorum]NHB84169.1 hypothetical protein [Tessaracoccus coleopterorum]
MIVADAFHRDVLATLAANRRALGVPIVAAMAGIRDRRRLAEVTGATAVTPSDLQAGYVPEQVLGHAARWSSTATRCWVDPSTDATTLNLEPQPPPRTSTGA